jgi:hypothetical protein
MRVLSVMIDSKSMRKSKLVSLIAITAICFALPLGAQEPQGAAPPSVMDNPLFHNPFAGQPQALKAPPGWPAGVVKASPKTAAMATTCAIPLLNAAPNDTAHYAMAVVSPQKDLDPKAFVPSMPVCGSSQQNAASLLKK